MYGNDQRSVSRGSARSRRSRSRYGRSRRGSAYDGSEESIEKKRTKVIGGHAMAIRDLNMGGGKEHKLESHGKFFLVLLTHLIDIVDKEFGKDDN